jgi:hypothetical protein
MTVPSLRIWFAVVSGCTRGPVLDLYALAFLAGDSAGMAEQSSWFDGKPGYEDEGLSLQSDTEAYAGRLRKALELTRRAVDSAVRADSKENGAIEQDNSACAKLRSAIPPRHAKLQWRI